MTNHADPTTITAPRACVLVVDDEPRNLAVARAILKNDHDVIEASSADEAYRRLDGGGVDLVLLDVMMPEIDGFTACREIKRRFAGDFLPVLLLTALGDQDQRNLGFEAGADDFISKPVDRRELQLRVRSFLRLRRQDALIRGQLAHQQRIERLKDDLSAMLVHDLRNPISGVDGLLHIMQRDDGASGKGQLLDWALLAMHNLRAIVDDMLKVRLIEEAQLGLTRRAASLRRIAAAASESLRGDTELRQLRVVVEGDEFDVEVDEPLLRRAIENLLANALRYTGAGTEITITVRRLPAGAEIDVADRGQGILDAHKAVLFEKYGSVEAHAGRARAGNGLGLYLVRLTAELHGGTVAALDRPDGGTIFRIALPAVP